MLLGIDIKMKVVAVFMACVILAGVAIAKPLQEDSAIVQLVNKVLSRSQSQLQQDAVVQSFFSRLRDMAMLQDILEDEVKEQLANEKQIGNSPIHFPRCICVTDPCPCNKKKIFGPGPIY